MHDIYKLKECLKMATVLGEVIKSSSDNRMYRAIRLPNQLECLLIHDPDS
jgi:secreted Zn-dependent insulinase-like peptidase